MSRPLNRSDSDGSWYSDLLKAIKQKQVDERKVEQLVLRDEAERESDPYKSGLRRALQTAAALGKASIVQLLLDNAAEVEATENEDPALFRAVEWGHCSVVEMLIAKGANLEAKDKFQRTCLFQAVSKGHVGVVKALLQARADVTVEDSAARTVILYVAAQRQDSKIDKYYGRFPQDPQQPSYSEGQTIMDLLLESNINLEAVDTSERTALHWAAATGKEKLLRSLLCRSESKRAKTDARTGRNRTPLHLAAEHNHPEIARILLEQGADFKASSNGAWTPLHVAAEHGHLEIVKLLIRYEAKLNAETTNGMTPLHWAATNGHIEIVRELLGQPGIKRHPKDSLGYTPLMRAAQHRNTLIMHLLSSSYDGKDLSNIAKQTCTEYKATVTDFFPQKADRRKFAVQCKPSIFDLLYGLEPMTGEQRPDGRKPLWTTLIETTKAKPAFRWIHLPANNMAWAEALITKYFTERNLEDVDGFKALAKSLSDQRRGKTDHSQFMRPSCHRIPSSPRMPHLKLGPAGPGEKKDGSDDKYPKPTGKASKAQTTEPSGSGNANKEINGNDSPQTPTRAIKEPKWRSEGPFMPATPPSPTRRRPSNDYFPDKATKRTEGKDRSQKPALLPNDSTLVEQTSGLRRSETDKTTSEKAVEIDSGNIALFMPYLHYEIDHSRLQMRETINKAFATRRAVKESQAAATAALTEKEMKEKKILLNETSLHPTRTLDQFYFPATASDTSSQAGTNRSETTDLTKEREESAVPNVSQTQGPDAPHTVKKSETLRKRETTKAFTESLLSKDQKLIHAYLLNAPPLHPRRTLDQFYYSAFDTEARDQDQVVYRYCRRHNMELKIFMVDQLWLWILGKDLIITSFPQRWGQPKTDPFDVLDGIIEDMVQPRVESVYDLASRITAHCSGMFYQDRHDEDYHFLDMFEHSISDLESKEPKLASDFDKSARQAKEWLDTKSRTEKYPECDVYFMNIGEEMAVLAEIKDIRNELSMISTVLDHQASNLAELNKAIQAEPVPDDKKEKLKSAFEEQGSTIQSYLDNIERMDKEANDLYTSVNPLLDLKQKYAGVFEARYARLQATSAVRQGHTIMVFTIVTIIFLPMSFIAAFFAVNIQEFGTLHLGYVSKFTFGIGLAISVPLIIGALTIDNLVRFVNRLTETAASSPSDIPTEQILQSRNWRSWLWHSKLPEKPLAENKQDFRLPGKTPAVLMESKATGARSETAATPTPPHVPKPQSSPSFTHGNVFGRPRSERRERRFSLVSRASRASPDPERGEG